MSIVKDQYDIKEKNTALFVACLKNSSVYEENDKIILVENENLNSHINHLISEKKFIEANELIKTAKCISTDDIISAEVTSKSLRLPFETYSKLLLISSKKNGTISDSVKQIIISNLYSSIIELEKNPTIEKNKVNLLATLLDNWVKRKISNKSGKDIFLDFSNYFGIDLPSYIFEIDDNVRKYFLKILYSACTKLDLDPQIADMYIDLHSLNYPHFTKNLLCGIELIDENLTCSIKFDFSYGIDDPATGDDVTNDIFYNNAIETFGRNKTEMFFNDIIGPLCDIDEASLGVYELNLDSGKLYMSGIDSLDDILLQKMVYNKLANEYPEYHNINGNVEILHNISLLPSDFDEEIYSKRLQESVENNDYETASKTSEFLEIHQILSTLSLQICDILRKIAKETKVVTITIPNALLNLFDLTRGEKSAKNFICEEVDRYWDKMPEME